MTQSGTKSNTYREILRSSSIIGGAEVINYLVALVRVKVVAVLLGPAGVGVISLYVTATELLGTVTGLGLKSSSVRSIAQANSKDDPVAVARTASMLRRLCWATGTLGWVASISLALPLSHWMFQSMEHAWALAILGGTLLMTALSNGQLALLQGLRRIGDIARAQVAAAVLNTAVTIVLYAWLREEGIVPVLLANTALTLLCTWWFARRVELPGVAMNWEAAVTEAKPMLGLGVAMMWSAVLALALDLFIRTILTRQWGVDATGYYQAAWSLSGLFAGFILGAMGSDFYPRLTGIIEDREAAGRIVNEQTEIGILLALPGLLATLVFAKWVIRILYSAEFAPAADVLVWMVLGVYGRVLSWPMGFIQLALGAARWFMLTEALLIAVQAALAVWLVPRYGVMGAAYAFVAGEACYAVIMIVVGHVLIGFRWSPAVLRMLLMTACLIGLALVGERSLHELPTLVFGSVLCAIGSLWSLRGLAQRLGPDHRLIVMAYRIPGLTLIIGG